MPISLLLPNLNGGGTQQVCLRLAREFACCGHTVEFVLMQAKGEFLPKAQRNWTILDLGVSRGRNVMLPLIRYLRQRQPDALLVAMWPLTAIAPLAARIAGFRGKVLVSEHCMLLEEYHSSYSSFNWFSRLALRPSVVLGYRLASARVGVSKGLCTEMAALSWMSPDQFVTIYNPVYPAVSPPLDQLSTVHALWATEGPRILNVANLIPVKNQALLLQAFAALPDPAARLMLVGRGPEEAALRALAVALGIANRVIFAGFHPDPAPFYATADLFVLSSDSEGFGNVIVEALSFGLPVVSTDCPSGPAEILEGGRYGRLVPPGDALALARAMEEALQAPVDRDSLKRRAADFAPEVAARKYLEVLELV
ncbi:MAG: glycosyl transferase [Thermosynechococcus sp.]|uniref:glycosyltransferase n=1 Tax=Thermosynechococcus sp. TaxID=2814275 RepID=UPI0022074033|nr:glycosyltransferase [Thermosynechococcus sp.]BCX13125.1 MAG: glycosyl transferase [Thermosynechococcus sp.]